MKFKQIPDGLFSEDDIQSRVVVPETPNPLVGTACWVWKLAKNDQGYGRIRGGQNKLFRAHRVSYTVFRGHIPEGFVLDHLCRNTSCVNPDHLEAVTSRINTKRGVGQPAEWLRARDQGRCIHGHLFSEVGVHRDGRYLKCAECRRRESRRWRAKKAARLAEGGGTG